MQAPLSTLGKTIFSSFTFFENNGRFVLCGSDADGERYRILNVQQNDSSIVVNEHADTFDSRALRRWLSEQSGPEAFQARLRAVAFLGFVCLLDDDWHMHFVTERSLLGNVGGHKVYRVGSAVLVPLKQDPESSVSPLLQKYRSLFNAVDMSKDFYFSDSFDLTRPMQSNLMKPNTSIDSFYCWNFLSIQNALKVRCPSYWLTPVTCGFFEQQIVESLQQIMPVVMTLLCRRSRMMAGTRYQRRGLSTSNRGEVANEVQTEIFVANGDHWGLHTSYAGLALHRGSIPLFWGHDQEKVSQPKPDIIFTKHDPDLAATEIHLKRLLNVYSSPVVCLSLIRQGTHKECSIGAKFDFAIRALTMGDRFRPSDIAYLKYDFLGEQQAGKSISEAIKAMTSDFALRMSFLLHNNVQYSRDRPRMVQKGVFRVNCIDCLDRTNFAQYCIAQGSFALFLEALGFSTDDDWESSYPKISNCLKDLFMNHGDRIANQYAGSGAMHKHAFSATGTEDVSDQEKQENESKLTMDQVRGKVLSTFGKLKTNAVNNNALTAIRRFYSNAVTDRWKNQAIQVFLGNYKPGSSAIPIWDLPAENIYSEELTWNADDEIPLTYPWVDSQCSTNVRTNSGVAITSDDPIGFSELK